MLRGIIGDPAFFGGLHYYASLYGGGNASTWDFQDAMETISGMELGWFFEEWIIGQAYPIYHYSWTSSGNGPYAINLSILQVQTAAPPFRMPVPVRIYCPDRTYDFLVENQNEFQTYSFTIADPPDSLVLDPDNWILKESEQTTGIRGDDSAELPRFPQLTNLYPNPFNVAININFTSPGTDDPIDISVYDITGRFIGRIADGTYSEGYHTIRFVPGSDGRELSSGIYFVRLSSGGSSDSRRVTYIK